MMKAWLWATLLAGVAIAPGLSVAAPAGAACCAAPTGDFPKVGGDLGNRNYSGLARIDTDNVARLGAAWRTDLEGGATDQSQQSQAVAVDGILYVETSQGHVFAVDGRTGAIKWRWAPGYGVSLRRGVAVGGGAVFTASAGKRVIALDQATGKPLWERQLIEETGIGSMKGPIVYWDGLVYVGSGDGSRGLAMALDARTGATVWKVYGAPGTGEFGSETWAGESWRTGGASPWMQPAIDPALGLVYWTFGNARSRGAPGGGPDSDGPPGLAANGRLGQGGAVDGSVRAGQNLFANSIVAMDARTGRRVWHFQSVHHDIWDLDNVMAPVLIEVRRGGRVIPAIVYGSKTGLFYVLDRRTGAPVTPIDEKPVPQDQAQRTWPTQPVPRGDTLVPTCTESTGPTRPPPHYKTGCLFDPHGDEPVVKSPGVGGANDWNLLSFNPKTRLVYTGYGLVNAAHSITDAGVGFRPLGQLRAGGIAAFDPATHRIVWRRPGPWSLAHGNGILSTAGDLLFIGQPDGYLVALDLQGRELWRFQTGAGVHTSPITYEVDGEQYVAVFAGGNALPYNSARGDHLWAFKLGGTVPPAPAPPPPSQRQPILAAAVEGALAGNTVLIGRTWSGGKPSDLESKDQNAMAPQHLRVPAGTTVTFLNPPGNGQARCATQFYEGLFDTGPLRPGQAFRYTFATPGEYFFNDCASPRTTGKVVVY